MLLVFRIEDRAIPVIWVLDDNPLAIHEDQFGNHPRFGRTFRQRGGNNELFLVCAQIRSLRSFSFFRVGRRSRRHRCW
jgi:hypothetical protein